jgi:hypothetical protein
MSIGGFPSFVKDMKVFQRERFNGHYGVLAFVIANTLSSMPYLALVATISGTITYYMVKLHPVFTHYLYFVLNLFSCMAVVESLMMTVATLVPNFLMGLIRGAGILGISMLVFIISLLNLKAGGCLCNSIGDSKKLPFRSHWFTGPRSG